MKKILIPVDFSDVTQRQIQEAQLLAQKFGAQVRILHVQVPIVVATGFPGTGPAIMEGVEQNTELDEKRLNELGAKLGEQELDVSQKLTEGDPADSVLMEAQEWGADYIVLGSHGHGGLYHLFLGSVSQGVVHKATCPVLIVPSQKS